MKNCEIEVHQASNISYNMTETSEAKQLCGDIVISIEKMKKQLSPVNEECSIYRVPKLLRKMKHTAYTPQVISIGPFHHRSRKDLIATEQYKFRHCINFLNRLDNKINSLELLVETTQSCMKEARKCYAEPIKMIDKDFVQMMVVDGCFVMEFLILSYNECHPNAFSQTPNNGDLSFYQRTQDIYADLIMLENQVPFFVLQRLFDCIPQNGVPISFVGLAFAFLHRGFVDDYFFSYALWIKPKHFVDMLNFYFVFPMMSSKNSHCKDTLIIPPSITELCEAGVTIKKAENVKCVMSISFKNGVLEIPPLQIDDSFEISLRNLIAYKQFPIGNESKCVQYVAFMDYLISTEEDVRLLVKAGIIINDIGGSDKEVSKLFNNLCKFVEIRNDGSFYDISKALHEHCNKRWNKAKASLKHNYFNTPWAIISFFAATLLIVLTLLQTIFSVISAFPN